MGFVFVGICVLLICMLAVVRLALNKWKKGQEGTMKLVADHATHRHRRMTASNKVRWMSATEISKLMTSDPDLVVFRLIDDDSPMHRSNLLPNELSVTLPELEEALPWIQRASRLAIYRPGGIDPFLERRLAAILHGRNAILLSGKMEILPGRFDQIAGEVFN
jgi:hypothetical protein